MVNIFKKMKLTQKAFKIIIWIFTCLLFFLAFILLAFGALSIIQGKQISIFGYSYSVVVTDSMDPTIEVNDIIIYKLDDFDNVKEGDIVVFYNPTENKNIVHRVVDILDDGKLETKGDNPICHVDEFKVSESDYIGTVTKYGHFLRIGSLIVEGRFVFFLAIFAIFAYVIVSEIFNIYKILLEKKKEEFKEKQKQENKISDEEIEKMKLELKAELEKELNDKKEGM